MSNRKQIKSQVSQSQLSDNIKIKFPHQTKKAVYFQTFIRGQHIYYIVQSDNYNVYVGMASDFSLLWQGSIKNRVSCAAYSWGLHCLYLGTYKGNVYTIYLPDVSKDKEIQKQQGKNGLKYECNTNNEQDDEIVKSAQRQQKQQQVSISPQKNIQQKQDNKVKKISGLSVQPILSIIALPSQQKIQQFISINKQGIMRRYRNNDYQQSIKLPFSVLKSIANKSCISFKDIAMVFLAEGGSFPYIFNWETLANFTQIKRTNSEVQAIIKKYESSLSYQQDQLIKTQKVSALAMSNTKNVIAVSSGNILGVYTVHKIAQTQWYSIQPYIKICQQQKQITGIDIVGSNLLIVQAKSGISTFNWESRLKPSKGLVFKGSMYQVGVWAQVPSKIIYGSLKVDRMKLIICDRPIQSKKKD